MFPGAVLAPGAEVPISGPPPWPPLSRCLNLSVAGSFSVPAFPQPWAFLTPLAARLGLGDREPRPKCRHRPLLPTVHTLPGAATAKCSKLVGGEGGGSSNNRFILSQFWNPGVGSTCQEGHPPSKSLQEGPSLPPAVSLLAFPGLWRHKPSLCLHVAFFSVSLCPLLFL